MAPHPGGRIGEGGCGAAAARAGQRGPAMCGPPGFGLGRPDRTAPFSHAVRCLLLAAGCRRSCLWTPRCVYSMCTASAQHSTALYTGGRTRHTVRCGWARGAGQDTRHTAAKGRGQQTAAYCRAWHLFPDGCCPPHPHPTPRALAGRPAGDRPAAAAASAAGLVFEQLLDGHRWAALSLLVEPLVDNDPNLLGA